MTPAISASASSSPPRTPFPLKCRVYSIQAEQVIVQVGSVTEISARLNVGSASATVVVSAEVPQVNTNSRNLPHYRPGSHRNLPINGGRWSSFALLTPGAVMMPAASD